MLKTFFCVKNKIASHFQFNSHEINYFQMYFENVLSINECNKKQKLNRLTIH